jgi:putative tryptophan/tyrosine transport system substrate-binding protein
LPPTLDPPYGSGMDRRRFLLTSLAGVVAAPLTAEAQQAAKIVRIGYLSVDMAGNPHLRDAFLQGLRDLGYVEGRNVVIEYRDAERKPERLPALAAELVALKVDVIVAGATPHTLAAKQRPGLSPLSSLMLAIRLRAGSSPVLRARAATSRGCPTSTLS